MSLSLLAAASAGPTTAERLTFWVLAVLAVGGAIGMLASRKAVHAALWLALTMMCLAVMYVDQGAVFLGVVQVVVYTGAVMMLFLFVLMLVGVDSSDSLVETLRGQRLGAILAGLGFGGLLVSVLGTAALPPPVGLVAAEAPAGGNVPAIAELLFSRYVWAFEITSALLITAAVGAMVLAHRERLVPRATQAQLARARVRSSQVTPLPAPGVFARHNAVDTPALLPDGSLSELSVPVPVGRRGDETAPPPVLEVSTVADEEEPR
jgi:NADH-quinone oxidoreductase subunit J